MKTLKTFLLTAATLIATISCNKSLSHPEVEQNEKSIVTFNISADGETKASDASYGIAENYNSINDLEIFIFNADDNAAKGTLDTYKKFTAADGLKNLKVEATTGKKEIYAIANSHRDNWTDIITIDKFKEQVSKLSDEDLNDLTMVKYVSDVTLTANTTPLTIVVERLVAKIKLSSIKTTFAGTPYEGMALSNVKAYLTNVHSSKLFHNGEITTPVILNAKKCIEEDVNACNPVFLYDAIPSSIADAGYDKPHYFFAYENKLENESVDNRYTRLVIEATLAGVTYYYPININQEGYGYSASNGHKGIQRNTEYTINVNILRPGSTDPDKPVEHGALEATISVLDWNPTTPAYPEF